MFKIAIFTEKIKEKSKNAFDDLKSKLTNRITREVNSPNLKNMKHNFLNANIKEMQPALRDRIVSNPIAQSRNKIQPISRMNPSASSGHMKEIEGR